MTINFLDYFLAFKPSLLHQLFLYLEMFSLSICNEHFIPYTVI